METSPIKERLILRDLYTEPEGLNIDGELPAVPKDSFKKGVYY